MKYLQDELYDCAEQSATLDKRMQSIRNLIAENKEEEEETADTEENPEDSQETEEKTSEAEPTTEEEPEENVEI